MYNGVSCDWRVWRCGLVVCVISVEMWVIPDIFASPTPDDWYRHHSSSTCSDQHQDIAQRKLPNGQFINLIHGINICTLLLQFIYSVCPVSLILSVDSHPYTAPARWHLQLVIDSQLSVIHIRNVLMSQIFLTQLVLNNKLL